jgi:hypothetical protein
MRNVNYAFEGLQSSRLCLLIEVYIWKRGHRGHTHNTTSTNRMSTTSTMHIRTGQLGSIMVSRVVISYLWSLAMTSGILPLSVDKGCCIPMVRLLYGWRGKRVDKGCCIPMVRLLHGWRGKLCMRNVNYAFEGLQSSRLCPLIEVYIWKRGHRGHTHNRSSTNRMSTTSTMHIRTGDLSPT